MGADQITRGNNTAIARREGSRCATRRTRHRRKDGCQQREDTKCGLAVSEYIGYLPHLNACLNATSAILLFSGWRFIKAHNVAAHRACQVSALIVSLLFLTSSLTYHYNHGTTRFQGTGLARPIYFTILTSHTILAIVIVPLVALTFYRAFRQDLVRHRA